MAASTITRATWTDGAAGTVINNARKNSDIYDPIDAMFAGTGSYTTFELGGLLKVDGFGGHLFSAGGTGQQSVQIRNTTAGTTNASVLYLGNDNTSSAGYLFQTSTTYTTAASLVQDALCIIGNRPGGISINAADAAGVLRFYTASVERARFLLSGELGIGTAAPTRQVHVYGLGQLTAALTDAGAKLGTLYIQDSANGVGNGGALILGSLNGYAAAIKHLLADGSNNTAGHLAFALRAATADTALTERMRLPYTGGLYLGCTASAANTGGLTINQGGADDEILSLKSSDISHTFTAITDADTYGHFSKYDPASGGLAIRSFSEASIVPSMYFEANVNGTEISTATTSLGCFIFSAGYANGTGRQALGSTNNLLVIRDNVTTRFIFRADGSSYEHTGTAWNTFDDEDDVALIEAAEFELSGHAIDLQFAQFLTDRRELLSRLGLVAFNDDGGHFVNRSRFQALLCGAVRQLARRIQSLETARALPPVE